VKRRADASQLQKLPRPGRRGAPWRAWDVLLINGRNYLRNELQISLSKPYLGCPRSDPRSRARWTSGRAPELRSCGRPRAANYVPLTSTVPPPAMCLPAPTPTPSPSVLVAFSISRTIPAEILFVNSPP